MPDSRAKGSRGEREAAAVLCDLGIHAERGQQRAGSPESPDVRSAIRGVHLECFYGDPVPLPAKMRQAVGDAGELLPVVLHRRVSRRTRGEPWLVTLHARDLVAFARAVLEAAEPMSLVPRTGLEIHRIGPGATISPSPVSGIETP